MERRPSPVLPPLTATKQNARWHHAFRQERKARAIPPVRLVPPTLPRPSGACASGEARGWTRAPSDVEVELVKALEALKGVQAALVAAQLAAQSENSLCASRGDACMDQRWKHECWFGRGGFSAQFRPVRVPRGTRGRDRTESMYFLATFHGAHRTSSREGRGYGGGARDHSG